MTLSMVFKRFNISLSLHLRGTNTVVHQDNVESTEGFKGLIKNSQVFFMNVATIINKVLKFASTLKSRVVHFLRSDTPNRNTASQRRFIGL